MKVKSTTTDMVGWRYVLATLLTVVNVLHGSLPVTAQTPAHLPRVSSHRGANILAPENTLAAFSKAIELGANFVEVDVRTTSDDVSVIMHDSSLKRTTGLDAKVNKTTRAEIKKLSAGKWFGDSYADQEVPTLEEVCALVWNENRKRETPIHLYVDCKEIDTGEVIRILLQNRLLDSAVFYGSVKTLKEVRRFHPKARVMPPYPGAEKIDRMIKKLHPYALDVAFSDLSAETVSHCHAKGIKVFSDLLGKYDNPEAYKKATHLGVDVIQTDDVSGVLNFLDGFELQQK